MDDLTHALAGALMGRAHPSSKRGLVMACVIGSLIPDIDVVPSLWDKDAYLTIHRGFTHSLLGLLPMSLLAAWIVWRYVRKKKDRAPFKALWAMAALGVASHILLDWCTSWGTMILWPDRTRFALDHLFIIDVWYWLVLAAPLAFSYYRKEWRVGFCAAGIVLVLAYHALAAFNHHRAMEVAERDQPGAWSVSFPQPFSPFRWLAYDRGDSRLRAAKIDFLRSPEPLEWGEWPEPPKTPDVQTAMDSPQGRQFLWFARVPMWEEEKQADGATVVYFWDLRFRNPVIEDKASRRFGLRVRVKDGQVVGGSLDK